MIVIVVAAYGGPCGLSRSASLLSTLNFLAARETSSKHFFLVTTEIAEIATAAAGL